MLAQPGFELGHAAQVQGVLGEVGCHVQGLHDYDLVHMGLDKLLTYNIILQYFSQIPCNSIILEYFSQVSCTVLHYNIAVSCTGS